MKVLIKKKKKKKKNQDHIPFSFAYGHVCIDEKFTKPIVVFLLKMLLLNLLKQFFKEYEYRKKSSEKHFNKNLIMTEKEEQQFQLCNTCWIFKNSLTMTTKRLGIIVT